MKIYGKFSMRKKVGFIILPSFILFLSLFVLAITPHYTCGCGEQIRKGSILTFIVNKITRKAVGKDFF